MKKEFDGNMDGKKVKTIVKIKEKIKKWFAKPKNKNIPTPHFEERQGVLTVHQDSADGTQYRPMQDISFIGSVPLPSGANFLPWEHDIAVVPMTISNNEYVINHSIGGAYVSLPFSGANVLIAKGIWGEWDSK